MKTWNILIVGVGGQGTLLASRLLGQVALLCGMDVKVSEVHGMAQRGGSVVTYVRMGEDIASHLIEEGGADVILAFEEMEAARYLQYAKQDAYVIMNTRRIAPVSVLSGAQAYPEGITSHLEALEGIRFIRADATGIAADAGSARAANVVMAGILSRVMGMDEGVWMQAVEQSVPPKTVEINKRAFLDGRNIEARP